MESGVWGGQKQNEGAIRELKSHLSVFKLVNPKKTVLSTINITLRNVITLKTVDLNIERNTKKT